MAYLDPAFNPGSRPQRLSDKDCSWKKIAFLVNFLHKTLFTKKNISLFFPSATFARAIILKKIKIRLNDLGQSVLYQLMHGYIQPIKVPILKECHFGRVKLWDVEHFWTLFVFIFGRDC